MGDSLRIGKISSIDYPKGTARVTYEDKDNSTTALFSFLAWQFWMPRVGDQVLTAHLSNGSCSAFILGPVWHDGHRPPEGFEGLYRKDYSRKYGLAFERYDAKEQAYRQEVTGAVTVQPSQRWTLRVGGCSITVDEGGVAIDAPAVTVTGDVIARGVSLDNHTHTGVHGETSDAH